MGMWIRRPIHGEKRNATWPSLGKLHPGCNPCATMLLFSSRPGTFAATAPRRNGIGRCVPRSEEHTSELQSLMRISYAVFCLKKKKKEKKQHTLYTNSNTMRTQTQRHMIQ